LAHEDVQNVVLDLIDDLDPAWFHFRRARDQMREHKDALIVCEALAFGSRLLVTSNMATINFRKINEWPRRKAPELGMRPRSLLVQADQAIAQGLNNERGTRVWAMATIAAAWPASDDAPTREISDRAFDAIAKLGGAGFDGGLVQSMAVLGSALRRRRDLDQLIESLRSIMPMETILSDRRHPGHPLNRKRLERDGKS